MRWRWRAMVCRADFSSNEIGGKGDSAGAGTSATNGGRWDRGGIRFHHKVGGEGGAARDRGLGADSHDQHIIFIALDLQMEFRWRQGQ